MNTMEIETDVSKEDGLFFKKTFEWGNQTIKTPLKTIPIKSVTSNDKVDEEIRQISETYLQLNATDLEAYRSGDQPNPIKELKRRSNHILEDELHVVFIEYTDARSMGSIDMESFVKLQQEYADVITAPCQPSLTDAVSPGISNGQESLEVSPYPAYKRTIEEFLRTTDRREVEKPVMGVLPPLGWSRRRDTMVIYEDWDLQLFAVDFRGLKPTTDEHFDRLKKLIADLAKRREFENRVLYAVNHRRYFPRRNSELHPSEGVALVGAGFDIIGGTHVHRGGFGDGPVTNIKVFEPTSFGFRNVPLETLKKSWPTSSTISPERFGKVSNSKRSQLRNLTNAESMNYGFRVLRKAIEERDEKEFLLGLEGFEKIEDKLDEIVAKYNDAQRPDVVET